ncbi:MAG: beta-galactosidase trimerization domain-containing protein, partial [Victivallales bacterium]|nr:beta-galactosidase trimerization domain-containing protein [Victivallales bacterium]
WYNVCACEHCRSLFLERTGFELPPNGDAWSSFTGDYRNPVYRAWLDFRLRTVEEFHVAVKEHYESLDFRLLRPNYCSHALNSNPSAYSLETLPQLDWVFQESCFSTIIRYSWPGWAVEQGHRYALGRVRGIPSMDMFYPDRRNTTIFCWALAVSWGAKYLGTDEGKGANETEKSLRQFEEKHKQLLQNQKKIAKIAFFDSKRNREMYGGYGASTGKWTASWIQACLFDNISCDILLADEIGEVSRFDLIILPDVAVLSDAQIAEFARFAANGGTLIWGGSTGSLELDGASRSADSLANALSISALPDCSSDAITLDVGEGRIVFISNEFKKIEALSGVALA